MDQLFSIDELRPDDKNFNIGTPEGKKLIQKSLQKFGAGRSILLDKNNRIIAGNKTAQGYRDMGGSDVRVIYTRTNTQFSKIRVYICRRHLTMTK
jgi:Mor family transcriptional regulator